MNPSGWKLKREISEFHFDQLIFDFVDGRLDEQRSLAMKKFLAENKEKNSDLESIKEVFDYCSTLKSVEVKQSFVDELQVQVSFVEKVEKLTKWPDWPQNFRWMIQAFLISSVAAIAAFYVVPWDRIDPWINSASYEVALEQIEETTRPAPVEPKVEPSQVAVVEGKTTENKQETKKVEKETKAPKASAAIVAPAVKKKAGPQGLLYRAYMSIGQLEAVAPNIVSDIESLGGKKAGKVRLGWKKPRGRYFHFSMPEPRYQELLTRLNNFGRVRIFKDPHWRVMPQGQIRVILWIEDADLNKVVPTPQELSQPDTEVTQPNTDAQQGLENLKDESQ